MSHRGMYARTSRRISLFFAVGLVLLLIGCGAQSGDLSAVLGGPSTTAVAASVESAELGDEWTSAMAIDLPADGAISVSGTIESTTDVDIFNLGALRYGDRLIVETQQGGSLDAALGLFDDRGMLMLVNDDRSYSLGAYDPYLNHAVREDLTECYLAIAASPAAPSTGSYTVTISRQPTSPVPEPSEQTVLLDFDGETGVHIGSRGPMTVPAFDAADISPTYAGQTNAIIDIIESMVAAEYAAYDVDFYSTAEGDDPVGDVTRIFFGGFDANLLGLADSVDFYNGRQAEECVVFTDTFELFMPLNPTVEEMGTALANVAAHELGHLLGLSHTRDITEIMDITAPAQAILVDQTLHESPLHEDVFPVGWQDPYMLLMQALGAP